MKGTEKAVEWLREAFYTVFYFAVTAWKEGFANEAGRAGTVGAPHEKLGVLGNGPALGRELPQLIGSGEHERMDFAAVNFFAEDERFEVLRPSYYVLSDPMFFRDSALRERVMAFYKVLDRKVAWPMHLYVQYYNPEQFDYRAVLPNPQIRIVRFHTQVFRGFPRLGRWLFRHGLGSANYGTVVQVGIYLGLLLGYKRIDLFGVDHTLLDGLCVDDNNRLCRIERHYYDDSEPEAKPILHKVPPHPYSMAEYLAEVAELFRGHEVLRDYAASVGARIVNRTRGSMIDAYERDPL